ncbi:MAG TPA: hypothetical protein VNH18_16120 [Bryobacteraceae bacterium]|nr:hypothetical protein [Bryobacteraceae bacterium]
MNTETVAAAGRVSELHKSAFWIYGVTALVMRVPFESVIRHASLAGTGDWQVRLEMLRVVVVLVLLARMFLAAGRHFDLVYIRADAAVQYPRRNYPMDFLMCLVELLIVVALSTTVTLHVRGIAGISLFSGIAGLSLLYENGWLAASRAMGLTAVRNIAAFAAANDVAFAGLALGFGASRLAGADAVFAEQTGLCLVLAISLRELPRLVREEEF